MRILWFRTWKIHNSQIQKPIYLEIKQMGQQLKLEEAWNGFMGREVLGWEMSEIGRGWNEFMGREVSWVGEEWNWGRWWNGFMEGRVHAGVGLGLSSSWISHLSSSSALDLCRSSLGIFLVGVELSKGTSIS